MFNSLVVDPVEAFASVFVICKYTKLLLSVAPTIRLSRWLLNSILLTLLIICLYINTLAVCKFTHNCATLLSGFRFPCVMTLLVRNVQFLIFF